MLENLNKMINDDNEVLNVLPQNNEANRKKYKDQLSKTKEKYVNKQKEVLSFMKNKNSLLRYAYSVNVGLDLGKNIKELGSKLEYFNPYHDAFEILKLDKYFYELRKYYDNELDAFNDNINKIIDIFNEAGVTLTRDDFYYGESCKKYMEVFISERQKGQYNSDMVKRTFEELYWKNHNMMRHILLNFYHLYYANEKAFNQYLGRVKNDILASYGNSFDSLLREYQQLIISSNENYLNSKSVFFDKFINKELLVGDFDKEKVNKVISEYISNESTDLSNLFMKLYASLKEEKFIYQYKFILDEVDKIYKEKDSNKNLVSATRKELDEIENKIYKNYKKINSKSFFNFKRVSNEDLYKEIEDSLLELDKKYDDLEENRYKEMISNMVNPEIKDYYLVGSSYLFMKKITKDQEDMDADAILEEVLKNVYSPYNGVIENINYENVSTLNFIIYDKYRLLGLNLTTDDFNEENLEGLTKTIENIIIYYALQKLEINTAEISFVMESDDIIKSMS